MTTIEMLEELAESWDVKLTSHEVGPSAHTWELSLVGETTDGEFWSTMVYRGALESVVRRAWAGERADSSHVS